ncbi:Fc.00g084150.m01.CDS01 [Cosmosporella sp. VM-42]
MASPMAACAICLDLNKDAIITQRNGETYSCCLQELSQSAESCLTCNILFQAIQNCYPEVLVAPSYFKLYLSMFGGETYQRPNSIFGLSVSPKEFPDTEDDPLHMVEGGWRRRVIHIYSAEGKPCPWPLFGPGTVIPSDHQMLAEQVKSWIEQCERNHAECRGATLRNLPKRVVQIIPGSKPGSCSVRLHESSPAQQGPYVCLSHCWGKHQIITTKRGNFATHKNMIPWDELSTTFQDAIEFTLRLGVEFIWIDSLCIIQDFTEDWEEEAMKMAAYYTNAHVTIAATAASDGTVGLFSKRRPEDEAIELEGVDAQGRQFYLIARTAIDHPFEVEHDALHEFPLMARGWVYQEHILSRRFLHFGPKELLWECHSETSCQCAIIPTKPRADYPTNQVLSVAKNGLDTRDVKARRMLWYENVESIMNLDFTFAKDRLPAAAGVATLLANGYKGRYLAGLWEDCLVADLCWVINENGQRPEELKGIPSWSWGSVTGGLATLWCQSDLSDDNVKMAARVIDIDCKPDPPSFIGHLTRGILTLEGRVAKATVTFEDVQGIKVRTIQLKDNRYTESVFGGLHFHPDITNWDTEGSNVMLLEMMSKCVDGKRASAVFLVLKELSGGKGEFERLGILRAQVRRRAKAGDVSILDRVESIAVVSKMRIC